MNRTVLRHNERTIWGNRGYDDGLNGEPRETEFPTPQARSAYFEGWRNGDKKRSARPGRTTTSDEGGTDERNR
jgi:ribosome modulation factor